VLGRLTRLCDGRVYGQAVEISWELYTSPDPPGQVVAAYRRRLAPLAPDSAGAQWTFRASDGAHVTGALTIGPSPAVSEQHCPTAPPRTRTYALLSRMMRRP
jgi:hypothetical protein